MVVGDVRIDFLSPEKLGIARYNSDGTLDTTFGTKGLVVSDFGGRDLAFSVDIQSNGKIFLVGKVGDSSEPRKSIDFTGNFKFSLARFNEDGSPDTTFGTNGQLTTDFNPDGFMDEALHVAVQPDDSFILVGSTDDASDHCGWNNPDQ